GQGELKKVHYDPLFKINHTCAMLRYRINRLVRRTWCTTKKIEMLENHLQIYIAYHNKYLLNS
ncbi:MAG: transposase, partial [Bacteriovorax sp.]